VFSCFFDVYWLWIEESNMLNIIRFVLSMKNQTWLVDFKENPKVAQEHMKNPMMMNKIQKVVNVGIVQMR